MGEPTPAPTRVGAWQAVTDSLGAGWERMVYLLFTGPGAHPGAWAMWGLILLIAGATGGGSSGSNWDLPGEEHWFPDQGDIEPWMIAVGVALLLILVALGIVWMYFQARFRFVLLEGVRAGEPRIRGVFGATRQVGGHYFLFNLALSFMVLLSLTPLLLPWIPVVTEMLRGEVDLFRDAMGLFFLSLLWVLIIGFLTAVLLWWVYDLVLPYAWLGRIGFRPGLERAWQLTKDRPEAILAFLVMRILVGVAGAFAVCILVCASCVVWIWPILGIVAAAMVSVVNPLLWIVTAPLILLLGLVTAWIITSVMAPVPLFYRAWSWAFVNQLDPSLPIWALPAEGPGDTPGSPSPPSTPHDEGPAGDGTDTP
jgi:hypothetical protein